MAKQKSNLPDSHIHEISMTLRAKNIKYTKTLLESYGYNETDSALLMNLANEKVKTTDINENLIIEIKECIEKNHPDLLNFLLEKYNENDGNKVDIDYNLEGGSPLELAVKKGNSNIVTALLEYGASPDIGSLDATPLMIAVYNGNKDIAKLLLNYGADKNLNDYYGNSIFKMAVNSNNPELVEMLIDNGKTPYKKKSSMLKIAIESGYNNIVELMLRKGLDADGKNVKCRDLEPTYIPLILAMVYGQKEVIKTLLLNGADIHKENHNKLTPFEHSAEELKIAQIEIQDAIMLAVRSIPSLMPTACIIADYANPVPINLLGEDEIEDGGCQ